ncbi:MAG: prolyl aminopeptidase [Acidimicrobiales bacterium]
MGGLYPPIEPYAQGHLETGDSNSIYWEECGSPDGLPVVVLHGGPGSGCTAGTRRFFDPKRYRIVLLDQRNCGRSRPHAAGLEVDLTHNTTAELVADMEALRTDRGIEAWMIFGHSWGPVLGLAYTELHPDRVRAAVLVGPGTGRRSEIDWMYRGGLARLYPAEWARFVSGLEVQEREDPVAAYHRRMEDPDLAVRLRAADVWTDWDLAISSLNPVARWPGRFADPSLRLARARICANYFAHDLWLDDGQLIRAAPGFAGIPAVIISGRLDLGSPLGNAWELAQAWPGAELTVVGTAGHSTSDPGMDEAIVAATDRLG